MPNAPLSYRELSREIDLHKRRGDKILCPQEGPQTRFLQSDADICIYGGAAGGGKTFGLLLATLYHLHVQGFNYTIFRKNYKQVFNPGGLWDEAYDVFSGLPGAQQRISDGAWHFHGERGVISKVSFARIERDSDCESYQGAQLCYIGFDELTHFSEYIFFYMLSRNRSLCGVKPKIKATCNPDADSWVAKFIKWWIDQETGYPIPERSGVKRWFIRRDEILYWADTREELWLQFNLKTREERNEPKSVTFIMSSVYDNKELLRINPGYLSNLKAMSLIERERLLKGNWKIKAAAGLFFKRTQLGDTLNAVPTDIVQLVRCWDLAATEKTAKGDPAYTAGVLMGKRKNGRYIVLDVINKQMSAADVRQTIKLTAQLDRAKYKKNPIRIRLPQDPGQAGKEQAQSYVKFLAGFSVVTVAESGSKESRAEPMAAQWQAGNFDLLAGPWNEEYLAQLENFPDSKFKDMVDASANGFAELEVKSTFNLNALIT